MKPLQLILPLILLTLTTHSTAQEKQSLVYLEHSNTLSFDEQKYPDAQLLKGDVQFRHEDVIMICDSALFYEKTNSLDAFGHIHLIQGDTIEGFADKLYYNGNNKLAKMRNNVRWIHINTTLTTDSLNYNRADNIAYYFTGGTIQDSLNTLTSTWGQYTTHSHDALFKDSVKLTNQQFILTSDTLCYNTQTYIAQIISPTQIIYEQQTTILTDSGTYNTHTEESTLLNHSKIIHNDGKSLTADTIFYQKPQGHGTAYHNVQINDSTNNITIYGHFAEVFENQKRTYTTDSALLIDHSSTDTLYLHADTLFSQEINYTIPILIPKDSILQDSILTPQPPDTILHDSTFILIKAFYNTRAFRHDMQMVCDSLIYNSKDSISILYSNPICWSDQQQISADSIYIYIKNATVNYAHCIGNAIAIQQDNPTQFNQLAGKEIKAFIHNQQLTKMNVDGNAQTIFFPRQEDNSLIGVNKTQSSYVTIFFKDEKIDHILFTTSSSGTLYPIDQISEEEKTLPAFFWAQQQRPLQPTDVFLNPPKTPKPSAAPLSATDDKQNKDKQNKKDKNKSTLKSSQLSKKSK